MVKALEKGLFDVAFFADQNGIVAEDFPKGELSRTATGAQFDPMTLLSALSQHTTHIGLAATASTTFHQPYQLARQFSSLDHLSGGRAGWNVVTSSRDEEARNFSMVSIPEKAERYERAAEMMRVIFGLWNSWEEGAFVHDKATRQFFDPSKMHPLNFKGKYFSVQGPLISPRTPQGRPVIFQAGASDDGLGFGTAFADVIYAVQNTLVDAQKFYEQVKNRAQEAGRDPDQIKIMPGILPIIGSTMAEAQEKYRVMQDEIVPSVGIQKLSRYFGDLTDYDLDSPPPPLKVNASTVSRGELLLNLAKKNNWTTRQLYKQTTIGHAHHVVVGTPEHIVNVMKEWIDQRAADGFNVLPAKIPGDAFEFVDRIVPELQERGLFRTKYEGTTLRSHLGLPLPH
jgi:alkanesulfonate monooxygenase